MKYKMKDSALHRMALFHMMGQLEDMGNTSITTAEIAAIMGVTKPTAIRRLNRLVKQGQLQKTVEAHRPNASAFKWSLTDAKRRMYRNGHLSHAYHAWRNEAFSDKE